MFVVVTTFYTLDGMKSILLPKFVFFRSRLRLSLKNTNLLFYCFTCYLQGVALRIITYPPPFTQGRLFCNHIIPQIGRENKFSAEILLLRTVEDACPYKCCVKHPYEKLHKEGSFYLKQRLYICQVFLSIPTDIAVMRAGSGEPYPDK